jgi:hypothetical protein
MALGVGPERDVARGAALLLEVVPQLRTGLIAAAAASSDVGPGGTEGALRALALQQARTHFSPAAARQSAAAQFDAMLQQLEFMASAMQPQTAADQQQQATASSKQQAAAGSAGLGKITGSGSETAPVAVRVTCSRKVRQQLGVLCGWVGG